MFWGFELGTLELQTLRVCYTTWVEFTMVDVTLAKAKTSSLFSGATMRDVVLSSFVAATTWVSSASIVRGFLVGLGTLASSSR